ncbi:aldo-keto reductase family 1 member B1 [Belonocnema kinseyi]|uniref:aldo-keto reductase family 1 member B1 n=1 Tax=Belonocnema kinseyi TaxID=2817044 RepID=UPI00143D27AD|nr:aldo-keto reductase family 1 member B1 [Belonocnema kinseyi]
MSSKVPFLEFSNGNKMPAFGLGTYLSKPNEVEEAVKYAIDLGYRSIDTAYVYQNENEVGKAIQVKIQDGTIKREDIFVTTKLWNTFHKEEQVVSACKESLRKLGLDYVDLYLIHSPMAFKEGPELVPVNEAGKVSTVDIDYLETWKGMEECSRQGLARNIGVSNFNSEQITRLLAAATIKPVNNQVELNININQKRLTEFCNSRGITITGYTPLGRPGNPESGDRDIPNFLENPKIIELAKKYGKTSAQIALRFVIQLGAAVIPKSVTRSRIKENFEIFDFELTENEMKILEALETGKRVVLVEKLKDNKYYPFGISF